MDDYLRTNREPWDTRPRYSLGSSLRAGLRITAIEEYPFLAWAMFPWMESGPERYWQLAKGKKSIPLMFSLKATRGDPTQP